MKTDWAADNLQVIRTLMERSSVYQRALGPVMVVTGAIGAVAAALAPFCPARFAGYWTSVAVVAVVVALLLTRQQALRDREPFWSPPTRRVAQAMAPVLVVGLAAGGALGAKAVSDTILAAVWVMLYGCGLHAAGFFTPPGVRRLGWVFLVVGIAALLGLLLCPQPLPEDSADILMGLTFGGLHLVYAVCLFASRNRPPAS